MPESTTLRFPDSALVRLVLGHRDAHVRQIEETFTVDVHARGNVITLSGDPLDVAAARKVLEALYAMAAKGRELSSEDVLRASAMAHEGGPPSIPDVLLEPIAGSGRRTIHPKTPRQRFYVDLIRSNDIVFGIGPAGTGKTYLAMAMAVGALLQRKVRRIVLTRPAVEAGEKLGFLPGDLREKVSPYLRPLNDALHDMMDSERAEQFTERGIIEIAPLAFMRGRTLNDSFVILDEAQNATREQMKMLLTRLGYGSKAVITGDTSQVDLVRKTDSGLAHAVELLNEEKGIGVCRFQDEDVVRHPLVRRVIAAYERDDRAREEQGLSPLAAPSGDAAP